MYEIIPILVYFVCFASQNAILSQPSADSPFQKGPCPCGGTGGCPYMRYGDCRWPKTALPPAGNLKIFKKALTFPFLDGVRCPQKGAEEHGT